MHVSAPTPSVAAVSVEDVPIKAIEILSVVVAQKLKKKVDEVPLKDYQRPRWWEVDLAK